MKLARLDAPMDPRPTPRWPRGTCFAWELLRGCRKGPMLDGTGPLLCLEIEESGESDGSSQLRHEGSAGTDAGTHSYPVERGRPWLMNQADAALDHLCRHNGF